MPSPPHPSPLWQLKLEEEILQILPNVNLVLVLFGKFGVQDVP
jgi:hypothetical protein